MFSHYVDEKVQNPMPTSSFLFIALVTWNHFPIRFKLLQDFAQTLSRVLFSLIFVKQSPVQSSLLWSLWFWGPCWSSPSFFRPLLKLVLICNITLHSIYACVFFLSQTVGLTIWGYTCFIFMSMVTGSGMDDGPVNVDCVYRTPMISPIIPWFSSWISFQWGFHLFLQVVVFSNLF